MKSYKEHFIKPFIPENRLFMVDRIKEKEPGKNPPEWITGGIFLIYREFFIAGEACSKAINVLGFLSHINNRNFVRFITENE